MIIVDAESIGHMKKRDIVSFLSGFEGKDSVFFSDYSLPEYQYKKITDLGIEIKQSNNPYKDIQYYLNEKNGGGDYIFTSNPLYLSLVNDSKGDKVVDPENDVIYSESKVKEVSGVDKDKIIDLVVLSGDGKGRYGFLGVHYVQAASFLNDGYSAKTLLSDVGHTPLKNLPLKKLRNQYRDLVEESVDYLRSTPGDNTLFSDSDIQKIQVLGSSEIAKGIERGASEGSYRDSANLIYKATYEGRDLSLVETERMIVFSDGSESVTVSKNGPYKKTTESAIEYLLKNGSSRVISSDAKEIYKTLDVNIGSIDCLKSIAFCFDNRLKKSSPGQIISLFGQNDDVSTINPKNAFNRIMAKLSSPVRKNDLSWYEETERPLCKVLSKMEGEGIGVDRSTLLDGQYNLEMERKEVLDYLKENALTGSGFDPSSKDMVVDELFNKRGLSPSKKTPKGLPSVSDEALENISSGDPFVDKIRRYRKINWALSNVYYTLSSHINPSTGKIHPSYENNATQNGRISSINPNIQGFPASDELIEKARNAFQCDYGCSYVKADYSQAELFTLAHLSGDSKLINQFINKEDIHKNTAASVLNKEKEDVTDQDRRAAKAINFGLIYGMTEHGLSSKIGQSKSESRNQIKRYFHKHPVIEGFISFTREHVVHDGFVRTAFGRRIYPDPKNSPVDSNPSNNEPLLRSGQNAPMQGTVSDAIKKSLVDVNNQLSEKGMRSVVCSQKYDEIILKAPDEEVDEVSKILVDSMVRSMPFKEPPPVDLEVSKGLFKDIDSDVKIDNGNDRKKDPGTPGVGSGYDLRITG